MASIAGKIITFSGASGSGKTTIAQEVLKLRPVYTLIPSLTTRAARSTDLPNEYRHISAQEFTAREQKHEFLWTISLHENRYGTLKYSVDEALLKVDPSVMFIAPDCIKLLIDYTQDRVLPFYILSPPEKLLRDRLLKRGESQHVIDMRIADCKKWDEGARNSGTPYIFIRNKGTIQNTATDVLKHLS